MTDNRNHLPLWPNTGKSRLSHVMEGKHSWGWMARQACLCIVAIPGRMGPKGLCPWLRVVRGNKARKQSLWQALVGLNRRVRSNAGGVGSSSPSPRLSIWFPRTQHVDEKHTRRGWGGGERLLDAKQACLQDKGCTDRWRDKERAAYLSIQRRYWRWGSDRCLCHRLLHAACRKTPM